MHFFSKTECSNYGENEVAKLLGQVFELKEQKIRGLTVTVIFHNLIRCNKPFSFSNKLRNGDDSDRTDVLLMCSTDCQQNFQMNR